MVDLVDESLAVVILRAGDKNRRELVSGCAQALKKFNRVHLRQEQIEHDATMALWKSSPQNIFRTIECRRPETGQADQSPERT